MGQCLFLQLLNHLVLVLAFQLPELDLLLLARPRGAVGSALERNIWDGWDGGL